MQRFEAVKLINQTFGSAYDRDLYQSFARNLLKSFEIKQLPGGRPRTGIYIYEPYRDLIESFERIGTYAEAGGRTLDVLVVRLKAGKKIDSARTKQRNFIAYYLEHGRDDGSMKDAALVAFVECDGKAWRFSLVRMEYELTKTEKGKVKSEKVLSPARRFSFLVGEGENTHTAQSRFVELLEDDERPTLEVLSKAFSVETITEEFFEKYRELFFRVCESLEKLIKRDGIIRNEFSEKGIEVADFAKKLLGQIVFLYFLQRKGWLGVDENKPWGTGPKNFLRRLFSREYSEYQNFFNDILEHLFYDMLAVDKGVKSWHEKFNCRIPFLNGGLFEPLYDYDWRKTHILIENELFSNRRDEADFDSGNGILDVFDRYNFTVKEDEPLEKEVAVDPELLGKVFENLLEVKDRKNKGSYYTPREVVYYMCQESLVSYLEHHLNQKVSRSDIITLIRFGDVRAINDARVVKYGSETDTYSYQLPESIRTNAAAADKLLSEIKVCDPAVGSGAFPLGMLNEIVRARYNLNPILLGGDLEAAGRDLYSLKWHAIENSIYGVDLDPGAVEIAKLRLWLSLIVDEESLEHIKPLPNLDFKMMQGNSLLEIFEGVRLFHDDVNLSGIQEQLLLGVESKDRKVKAFQLAQHTFFNASHKSEKERLRAQFKVLENELIESALAEQKRTDARRMLDEYRRNHSKPYFLWRLNFGEIFENSAGFDIVIGNPPYDVLSEKETNDPFVKKLIKYAKEDPILSHSLRGKGNLYKLFCCKGLSLTKDSGQLCFIVPMSLLGDDQAKTVRAFLFSHGTFRTIDTFPQKDDVENRVFRSAKVATCIFQIRRESPRDTAEFSIRTHTSKTLIGPDSTSLSTTYKDIKTLDNDNLLIPVCSGDDWKIVRKIIKSPRFLRLGAVATQFQGEVNETSDKSCLSQRNGVPILRGANITLYAVREASQGETLLLDSKKYLRKKAGSKKLEHHAARRLGFQRSAPQNNFRRLIATIINPGPFCFDTVSYVPESATTIPLEALAAVLNSKLADFFFRCFSTNSKINEYQFNLLPFFKTERELSPKDGQISYKEIIKHLQVSELVPTDVLHFLVNTVKKIISIEATRILNSRRERAYLATESQDLQKQIDCLLYEIFSLETSEIKHLEDRLTKML